MMERPTITISGDPSSRLKPMKLLASRTRRVLRLSTTFLAVHKQQCSPSSPIPSHPLTTLSYATLLPAVSLCQHTHQQGAHQSTQGEDGDCQRVEEGQGARGQSVSIPVGPCGIVESFYVLHGRERRTFTKCVGRKGKTREDRPHRESVTGLTAMQEMQGRMCLGMTGMCWSGCSASLSTRGF